MRAIEQIPQLPIHLRKSWPHYLVESIIAGGGVFIITALIAAFRLYPTIPNITLVYLLLILILASTRGLYAAVLAAVIAFLSFDFFLIPPFYSLTIDRWEEWLALFVFLVTALLTGYLATRMRSSMEQAWLREREARILYEAGRVINRTNQLDEQLDSIALSLVRVFSPWGLRACALLLPNDTGTLTVRAEAPITIERFTLSPEEVMEAREVMAKRVIAERSETSSSQPVLLRFIALKTADRALGVLCLRIEQGVSWCANAEQRQEGGEHSSEQTTFFWTFLDQAILIIERAQLQARVGLGNE